METNSTIYSTTEASRTFQVTGFQYHLSILISHCPTEAFSVVLKETRDRNTHISKPEYSPWASEEGERRLGHRLDFEIRHFPIAFLAKRLFS